MAGEYVCEDEGVLLLSAEGPAWMEPGGTV